MRKILFKAKTENGRWIEGDLIHYESGEVAIIEKQLSKYGYEATEICRRTKVDKDTICQYTGLTDKNGNKVWENDVVRFKHEKLDFDDGLELWERTCLPNKKEYKRNYVVEFCNTPTNYGLRFRNGSIWFMVHRTTIVMHDVEVIGNIFDNAELLEGE